jgi:hypothetical protein
MNDYSNIKFPPGFIQISYPGYFWHPESERLYSIKSGLLKPLALNKFRGVKENGIVTLKYDPNFAVSVKGRAIRLSRQHLKLGHFTSEKQEIQLQLDL